MVEIAIFWFQIHITNGFMHRKWHTGNQYMVKSAENRMRSNLELPLVINAKRRPRYISALKKKLSPIYHCPKNLYTILMHWMSVKLSDSRAFMAVPVSIDGKSILTLYNSTLQKVHKSKYNFYFNHPKPKDLHDLNIRKCGFCFAGTTGSTCLILLFKKMYWTSIQVR